MPKVPAGHVQVATYIPAEVYERLRRVSFELHIPQTAIHAEALISALNKLEKKIEQFHHQAS